MESYAGFSQETFGCGCAALRIKAVQTDKTQSFGSDALDQRGATNLAETVDLPAEASAQAGALTRLIRSLRPTP